MAVLPRTPLRLLIALSGLLACGEEAVDAPLDEDAPELLARSSPSHPRAASRLPGTPIMVEHQRQLVGPSPLSYSRGPSFIAHVGKRSEPRGSTNTVRQRLSTEGTARGNLEISAARFAFPLRQ